MEEVRGGRAEADVAKVELPLRISLADYLWVVRVIDCRIRAGQAGRMLKELSKYPLRSSCMDLLIRQQSRPRLMGLAEEVVRAVAESGEVL